MQVIKRDKSKEEFDINKILNAVTRAFQAVGEEVPEELLYNLKNGVYPDNITVEEIQNIVEDKLMSVNHAAAKAFILYREQHKNIRNFVATKEAFIAKYKQSSNTANATIDDNSNVGTKNIGVLNAEIHKEDNKEINRGMVTNKLKELFPNFDYKQYRRDLEHHIIYKHDESSMSGAIAPYCCSISMYPFLLNGLKDIGGLSAAPKNLDSFCGLYINLVFAVSAQFLGAVATSEVLLYFDYFCRKEWGDSYWQKPDMVITNEYDLRKMTIQKKIHQYFQQIIYSINQPAAARGLQSAFVNWSYFDHPFFDAMFGNFVFPDGSKPIWESLNWLQKDFMQWFNEERLKCILTFPVESFALIYKDGHFADQENADFVAKMYSKGHSFFTYISDTADSLSSCCFSKDTKFLWKASTSGVHCTTFEEFMNLPYSNTKENYKVFHNGSWIKGNVIKFPIRKMFKITTYNNKEFIMSDNHINLTWDGEKPTEKLTTEDYLMFNTSVLNPVKEIDEHLSYEQGLLVGMFIGDGTFGNYICEDGSVHDFTLSLNKEKIDKSFPYLTKLGEFKTYEPHNNVYHVRCYSKELTTFIARWTGNEPTHTNALNKSLNLDCLLQSVEFRKGILDGWYLTDGGNANRCYTISKQLVENMEILCTSLGLQSIINVSDRTDESVVIRGQEFNRNYPLYCLRWYTEANHRCNKTKQQEWKKKNNSIYWKIKSIEPVEYSNDIYCIECNNHDEPYFTLPCGLITHNCRLKNKLTTHEFSFTNGNMGVETGSKSVITLNLSRMVQDDYKYYLPSNPKKEMPSTEWKSHFKLYLDAVLERVYKYHVAYNECLWDMYDANLLPVYKAGFISLNKQYLTIGINGLNAAAEFLGIKCNDNKNYQDFCEFIFSTIKDFNTKHNGKFNGHKVTLNCECVPAESLAVKNYNWDKKDGYWVNPNDTLYASYIFKPNDEDISVLDKFVLHGNKYIGDYLDGGAAAHINLDHHLDEEQYKKILKFAAENGCQYFTFNIPNCQCDDCGFITKHPIDKCPKCGSTHISWYDRIIG